MNFKNIVWFIKANDNNNNNDNNNHDNKLKTSIALFPDVIKSALQTSHIKLNTILNGITN